MIHSKLAKSSLTRERSLAFLEFTWHRFLEDRCLQTAGAPVGKFVVVTAVLDHRVAVVAQQRDLRFGDAVFAAIDFLHHGW